jgi:CRISPR/Cas system-associated exonuclease Cas4 (RecB family)
MPASWSYSSLSLFKQCPRKYHRLRVVRDIVEPETEQMRYGTEVHKAAEDYGRDGTPIPEKYAYIKPYVDTLIGSDGVKLYEQKMALDRDLNPCEFFDTNYWWRGIADFMAVPYEDDGDEAIIVDYKTGKSARFADTDQLQILGLATFAHFPHIQKIRAGLLFVVSKEFIETSMRREDQETLWKKFLPATKRLDMAYDMDLWNPSPNFTCKKFCPVLDCEHNGRG